MLFYKRFLMDKDPAEGGGNPDPQDNKSSEGTEKPQEVFKAFATEEEFNKHLQSVNSKGKFEILQELGVKTVAEAKDLFKKANDSEAKEKLYAESNSRLTELEGRYSETKTENESLKAELLVNRHGIPEILKDEFLTLVKAGIKDDVDAEASATKVVEKFKSAGLMTPDVKVQIGSYGKDKPKPMDEEERLRKL